MPENYSKLCLQGLSPHATRAARGALALASAFPTFFFTDFFRGFVPSAAAAVPAGLLRAVAWRETGRLRCLPSRQQLNGLDCHAPALGQMLNQLNICNNKWGQNRA
ncbi:hypothetical protein ACFMBG_01405 [Leisingera sp. D0M16]|uniref:hypothetical protein n=1 Tax=Leisingera coralii TaxID=3351347 RepID=UPI003B7945C3